MAIRFLTVMRAKVDDKNFDPREYIKVVVKKLHFDNYTAVWLARREKEVERGHLSRGYLRSVLSKPLPIALLQGPQHQGHSGRADRGLPGPTAHAFEGQNRL